MSAFTEIKPEELNQNFFQAINKEWMLITAGDQEKLNTMTASWGGIGILWNKPVAFSFVRKSRYTLEFLNQNEEYTLSFFGGKFMKELLFCGRNSGRDTDKLKETGLVPVYDEKAPYFEQAELVFVCRKLYRQSMNQDCLIDKSIIPAQYSNNDWHEIFIGEIIKVLKKS